MAILDNKDVTVSIQGKEYKVKELSLAQKNRLLGSAGEVLRSIANNAFFRKNEAGGLSFSFIDEVSLAELNFDKIILTSIEATSELLRMAIPDFKDWDNLPESASREALRKAVEVQDFKGYIANFFSLAKALTL
jgi:hypothetical protein